MRRADRALQLVWHWSIKRLNEMSTRAFEILSQKFYRKQRDEQLAVSSSESSVPRGRTLRTAFV